ncbi:MAG TPA: hypothetical protein VFN56_03795 [Candidatus Saccharimonadales bacterium]|nr:hypothetical protein [Candidatus Saccharimonadales bacterium]
MVWFWLSPIINGLVLFTPGFIWFSLIGLIWQRPEYKTSWEKLGLLRKLGWLMLWPVTTLLLIYAFWHNTQLLYSWAGLPQHFASLQGIARNIGSVWTHILFRGFQSPLIGLGYLPLVNVFTTSMALVGGYFYVSHWRATRSKVIFSLILVGTILSGIGGPVSNSINMPVIFLLAAGGIGYLLHEWLKVFPRNPLAKYAGYSLITLSITISVIYNTHQFYIAWPHNTATKIAFSHRN